MSFIFGNFQFLVVTVLTSFLIFLTSCSGQDYCSGFSEVQFGGVECFVKSETETPCTNYNKFSIGTALKFRCQTGYKSLALAFSTGADTENLWHHSTCVGNKKWSNDEIRAFACEVDYGFFDSLRFQPLINGGTVIEQKSVPWNSAIFVLDTNDEPFYRFICGATLIHPSFILTAAHCLDSREVQSLSDFKIVLGGSTSVYTEVKQQDNVQIFDVRERYAHPDYAGERDFPNDIGVMELVGKVKISEFALPIKMPTAEQAQTIEEKSWTMQVNGLGVTDNDGTAAKSLYGVNVTSRSRECDNFYEQHPTLTNRGSTLCLAPISDSGICRGDSGSGTFLAWPTPSSPYFYIQGVVSAGTDGNNCNRITIFTKVWPYRAWIEDVIKNKKVQTKTVTTSTTTVKPTTSSTTTTVKPRATIRPTTSIPDSVSSVLQVGVNLHNDYRRQHRAPDLIPDENAQQAAREHCIYLANTFFLTARPGSPYGQNLYQFDGPYISDNEIIRQAVNYWYSQINSYNWNYPPFTSTSTFTQVVWRSTRYLGLHVERRGSRTVVVAMYFPKGNIDGQFQANVLPPQAQGGSQFPIPVQPPIEQTTSPPAPIINPTYANDWRSLGLQLHNDARRNYGVSPLQLDQQLTNEAQAYADYIVQTNYNLSPKQGSPYGQNTFQNTGRSLDPSTAIRKAFDFWYSGASEYNYQNPLLSSALAQLFSQVVWKSSTRLGLGIASQSDRTIVIAFYSPAGNVASDQSYRENVFPPNS